MPNSDNSIAIFLESIQNSQNILLTTNQEWNADNMAAVYAFAAYLIQKNVNINVFSLIEIPHQLKYLFPENFLNEIRLVDPSTEIMPQLPGHDTVVTIGALPESNKEFFAENEILHLFIAYNTPLLSEPNFFYTYPTTLSEMIFDIWQYSQLQPNVDVCNALYTGILYSTQGFQSEKTTQKTHETIAYLLKYGDLSPHNIYQILFEKKPLNELFLLKEIAQTSKLYYENRVVTLKCTYDLLNKDALSKEMIYNVAEYPLISKHIQIILMTLETDKDNFSRIILYTKNPYNSLAILDHWNPLGDAYRAEAILPFSMEEAQQKILTYIEKILVTK